MRDSLTIFIIFFACLCGKTQVTCSATADSGSGYSVIENAGLGIENPDCVHTDFGAHITQAYDLDLDKNVFVFHSHINEDNDRCIVFDRVRMEMKGGPNTDTELQHLQGGESFYRWKFKLNNDFVGASSFNHLFQNKAYEGDDAQFPILTITARADIIEVRHNGGDTGNDLDRLAEVDLNRFRGKWVEVYMRQIHSESGELHVTMRDMQTGKTILDYSNNNIDLWRIGSTYNRPKWGMYRAKNAILKDEEIRFSDFCITETDVLLCPAEAVSLIDTVAPTAPTNLLAENISMTSVDLSWETAFDLCGVAEYDVLQDGIVVQTVTAFSTQINNLNSATTYTFTIMAIDDAGNISPPSNTVTITTDAENTLPDAPFNLMPVEDASDVPTNVFLKWESGSNTDSFQIFLGQNTSPPIVNTQVGTDYQISLSPQTIYFWKVAATNSNGKTESRLGSFTTGASNSDFPWQVYRANFRPEEETNFLVLNEAPINPPVDQVIVDPNGSPNTFFGFRSNTVEEFRWRHEFDSTDSSITVVVRLRAVDPAVSGVCYLEVRNGGWRQKIRINQSTLKLEKASPVVEVDLPFDIVNQMQLIRIVSTGQNTTVFFDENPIPAATAISDTPSANTYFEWGKSGGVDYGAYIDWLAIDKTGLFAPEEGTDLPSDLFLSSIATLTKLEIDGTPLPTFDPNTFDYNVNLIGTDVPTLTWETTSDLAKSNLSNPMTVPNSQAIILVTAQDGFTVKEYKINYVSATSTNQFFGKNNVEIYPNPTMDELRIDLSNHQSGRVSFYSTDGRQMQTNLLASKKTKIDISLLPRGFYFLKIQFENSDFYIRKIVLK